MAHNPLCCFNADLWFWILNWKLFCLKSQILALALCQHTLCKPTHNHRKQKHLPTHLARPQTVMNLWVIGEACATSLQRLSHRAVSSSETEERAQPAVAWKPTEVLKVLYCYSDRPTPEVSIYVTAYIYRSKQNSRDLTQKIISDLCLTLLQAYCSSQMCVHKSKMINNLLDSHWIND